MQDLQVQMLGLWKPPGLQGRCLDMIQLLYCSLGCSPQQSTFKKRNGPTAPPLSLLPDASIGETCVNPTCANIDGLGTQFSLPNCGSGYHLRSDLGTVSCASAVCSAAECCEADVPTCSDTGGDLTFVPFAPCPATTHFVPESTPCVGGMCTAPQCCAENPTCSQAFSNGITASAFCGAVMVPKDNLTTPCQDINCTQADCCDALQLCPELSTLGDFIACGELCVPRGCSAGSRRALLEMLQTADVQSQHLSLAFDRTRTTELVVNKEPHRMLQAGNFSVGWNSTSNISSNVNSSYDVNNSYTYSDIEAVAINVSTTCVDDPHWLGPGNVTCADLIPGYWQTPTVSNGSIVTSSNQTNGTNQTFVLNNNTMMNSIWVNGTCELFLATMTCPATCGACQALLNANVTCEMNEFRSMSASGQVYCAPTTTCNSSQYESVPATASSDRLCTELTVCSGTEFELVPPTNTSDRQCQVMTTCHPTEQFTSVPATATTDRQCDDKVEVIVCMALCQILYNDCGSSLLDSIQVSDPISFCNLLFHKQQIRVENSTIDIPEFDSNQNQIPHCLYINTPPMISFGFESKRIFLDETLVSTQVSISDIESAQLPLNFITISLANPSLATIQPRWSYLYSSFMLDMTPSSSVGDTTVTVCAKDDVDGSYCASFLLEVRPHQTPPVLNLNPGGAIQEDQTSELLFSITEVDLPPETVVVTVQSSNTVLMPSNFVSVLGPFEEPCNISGFPPDSVQLYSCRALQMHAVPDSNGQTVLFLEANDGVYTSNASFQLTVLPVNDPPTITSSFVDIVAEEDSAMTQMSVVAIDDGDPVINSLTGQLDSGALFLNIIVNIDPGSVVTPANYLPETTSVIHGNNPFNFTMILPQHAFGEAIVNVDVSDGQYLDREQFHLTVLAVNDAPNISFIAPISINEDSPMSLILPLVDVDNPMDQLYITGSSTNSAVLPSADLSFSLANNTWFLEIVPLPNAFGMTLISVGVTDGLLSSAAEFNLTVISVNDPPVAENISSQLNNTDLLVCLFDIFDVETDATLFQVAPISEAGDYLLPCTSPCIYASSSHNILVPLQNVQFGGVGSARFITIEPNQIMSGDVTVSVYLDDGQNISHFDLDYSLIAMTVDLSMTLVGSIEEFDLTRRQQVQHDLAQAASVAISAVTIVDVQPGSIIVVAAIMVASANQGQSVANELSRRLSFGDLTVGGFQVQSMSVNVVGSNFELSEWDAINDVWGALLCAMFSAIIVLIAAAHVILVSKSSKNELIEVLKIEIIEKQEENGDISFRTDLRNQNQVENLSVSSDGMYVAFDIRHMCIWVGVSYESLQIAWHLVDATINAMNFKLNDDVTSVLDFASFVMLDFRHDNFFFLHYVFLAIYGFLPALWLLANVVFVILVGYAVIFGYAWNKYAVAARLDRMVARYWTMHWSINTRLLYHRDEICAVFFDGILMIPVLRSCFKVLICKVDLKRGSTSDDRTKIRFFETSLYMSGDEYLTCWSGAHLAFAGMALVLIVSFLYLTVRYTAEIKGRPGGAMHFSSRIESLRVMFIFSLVAGSQILSDRPLICMAMIAGIVVTLLVMNVLFQPALGCEGASLNSYRSFVLAGVCYSALVCGFAVVNEGLATPLGVAFAVCTIPFACAIQQLSKVRDRRRRSRFTRHIESALVGEITQTASIHAVKPGAQVNEKQLSEFVHSSADLLVLVLNSEDSKRRAYAASALGELALGEHGNTTAINMEAANHLSRLFSDSSAAVRVAALSALGMLATSDEGLIQVATKSTMVKIDTLLKSEEDAHVFSAISGLLCAIMHCNSPDVRHHSLNTLLMMTSHSMLEARETAWSALHKLGIQTNHNNARDEVLERLIKTFLDRTDDVQNRLHAARKIGAVITTSHQNNTPRFIPASAIQKILAAILCSNDPQFTAGETGVELVAECTELVRIIAISHDTKVSNFIISTTLAGLTREANESEGVERFKVEIREAARRMGVDIGNSADVLATSWQDVFRYYDDDGSGELDIEEFTRAMRLDCEIPKHKIPDDGLIKLFNTIDGDGGGTIDAEEFAGFLEIPYQPDPAFATLYELSRVESLQEAIFHIVTDHMGDQHEMLRREMAAEALEILSKQNGCIERLFEGDQTLQMFISRFQSEPNDMVSGALAAVLVNFASDEENLDKLFNAGIFDGLAVAIKTASIAKAESLIDLTRGVVKKHPEKATSRIVPIFGDMIETEQWNSCKEAALKMLLYFCDLVPQFCLDTLEMLMQIIEKPCSPEQKLPAVSVLGELAQLPSCAGTISGGRYVHRLLEHLRGETGLRLADAMGYCLCVLTSVAPLGQKVDAGHSSATKTALGSQTATGLARFKQAAKRVIEHKDMISFVFRSVMQQIEDGCRFPALVLQQLVAHNAKNYQIGQEILRTIVTDLRMQDMADAVLKPRRRLMASDALAIIAADPDCLVTIRKARIVHALSYDLLPYEFGFERIACRAVARMAFESEAVCNDVVATMLACLGSSAWAVREGAACTLGLMATLTSADRPTHLIEAATDSIVSQNVSNSAQPHVIQSLTSTIGRTSAVNELLSTVVDNEIDVAASTCLALAHISAIPRGANAILQADPPGVPVLAKAMKHMSFDVRAHAATALGAVGSHTREGLEAVQAHFGLDKMVSALQDQDVKVREVS